jgi:hypothetical protein
MIGAGALPFERLVDSSLEVSDELLLADSPLIEPRLAAAS